jgi:hypothetical protein
MSQASFLPEDYLQQKSERRTNLICLTLFAVVMFGVFAAFLVTNRSWTQIKNAQQVINVEYQQAALRIEELTELQAQEKQMRDKAELAGALVERIPRSILLAELINRMPQRLSLISFEMKSEKLKSSVTEVSTGKGTVKATRGSTGSLSGAARAKTKEEAAAEPKRIEPPRYKVNLTLLGVAPTDLEVSRYIAELTGYPMVQDVSLDYSIERQMGGSAMREFKIKMVLNPQADARNIEPLLKPRRPKNPMSDELELAPDAPRGGNLNLGNPDPPAFGDEPRPGKD